MDEKKVTLELTETELADIYMGLVMYPKHMTNPDPMVQEKKRRVLKLRDKIRKIGNFAR